MISFIVSAYDRPGLLLTCLASLQAQQVEKEVIVTCNNRDDAMRRVHLDVAYKGNAALHFTQTPDCYYAAESIFDQSKGEWVCFPSDDSYYTPWFAQTMLQAAREHDWDFVYADMLYKSQWNGGVYEIMDVRPMRNWFDKTCFMVKRSLFNGFPGKNNGYPSDADGQLAEELVAREVSHGKCPGGALLVHS